jgi:RNA polymerase sigma-70 factor (ECF subfamily)
MFLRRKNLDTVSIDETPDAAEGDQEPMQIVDWCCMPEEEMMSSEAKSYLDQAIGKLAPNLRVVFVLRDIQGLDTQEVSQVLDLSETAVKTRLSRARMQLREELSGYYGSKLREGKPV